MADWIDVVRADELSEGERTLVCKGGRSIVLFRVQGVFHALDDHCPHAGSSLAAGRLEGTTIVCRAHGLRFDLSTGCLRSSPGFGTQVFPVRLREGRVEIGIEPVGAR